MSRRTEVAIGALVAVALCAIAGVSAGLADDTVKSKVKITEGGPNHFEGKVTSREEKCEKGRKVSLQYEYGGPYRRGQVLDSDRTDADGDWELDGSFQAGLYQASVKKKTKGDLTCRGDRSIRMQF